MAPRVRRVRWLWRSAVRVQRDSVADHTLASPLIRPCHQPALDSTDALGYRPAQRGAVEAMTIWHRTWALLSWRDYRGWPPLPEWLDEQRRLSCELAVQAMFGTCRQSFVEELYRTRHVTPWRAPDFRGRKRGDRGVDVRRALRLEDAGHRCQLCCRRRTPDGCRVCVDCGATIGFPSTNPSAAIAAMAIPGSSSRELTVHHLTPPLLYAPSAVSAAKIYCTVPSLCHRQVYSHPVCEGDQRLAGRPSGRGSSLAEPARRSDRRLWLPPSSCK